jgi:hypothetical protein
MVTVRTIKLKRSSQAYGDSGGSGNLSAPAAPENVPAPEGAAPSADPVTPSSAPIADAPAPAAAKPNTVPGKSTVWFMLIALFAVIGLLTILGLQYSEMSFFKIAPSVWLPGK